MEPGQAGYRFRRGHLHCLLTNPLYAGRIRHQRRVYEGQHPSIIAPELWDAVQAQLQAGAAKPRKRTTKGRAAPSPLAGKLFDETGDRLTPSHTKKKTGQRLRYYVSRRLIQHSGQKDLSGWRLPAPMLEQTVVHLIRQHVDATTFSASLTHTSTMQELASVRRFLDGLCSGTNDDSASAAPLLRLIRRVDISPGSVSILLDCNAFAACLSMGPDRIRALLHGSEQIADLPVPVAESPGAVRIVHPERGHLVEYLAPNSVFNSLPRQRSSPHLRPDDRLVTIDRVFHHASLGAA